MLCFFHTTQPLMAVPFTEDSDIHPCLGSPQQPCGVGRGEGPPSNSPTAQTPTWGLREVNGPVQDHRLGMFGPTAPSASVLCLPVGCTSGPDAPRGFCTTRRTLQIPLARTLLLPWGAFNWKARRGLPAQGKGLSVCHAQKRASRRQLPRVQSAGEENNQ